MDFRSPPEGPFAIFPAIFDTIFLLLMGTSERVMNVQVMVHLFRSFVSIRSHASDKENRHRNRIKNCNCKLNGPYDDVRVFWKSMKFIYDVRGQY